MSSLGSMGALSGNVVATPPPAGTPQETEEERRAREEREAAATAAAVAGDISQGYEDRWYEQRAGERRDERAAARTAEEVARAAEPAPLYLDEAASPPAAVPGETSGPPAGFAGGRYVLGSSQSLGAEGDLWNPFSPITSAYRPRAYAVDPEAFRFNESTGANPRAFLQRGYSGPQIGAGQQGDTRAQQQAMLASLQSRAAGTAPSAAEMQLQQGLEAQQRQALSAAAGARGANPALALKMAQEQQTAAGLGVNQQAAQLRAQEQAQAESQLAGALSGIRGQDIAAREQDIALRGQDIDSDMRQQQLNQQMTEYYESLGLSREEAALQARIRLQELNQESAMTTQAQEAAMARANIEGAARVRAAMYGAAGEVLGGAAEVASSYLPPPTGTQLADDPYGGGA